MGRPVETLATSISRPLQAWHLDNCLRRTSTPVKHLRVVLRSDHVLPALLEHLGDASTVEMIDEGERDDYDIETFENHYPPDDARIAAGVGCTAENLVLTGEEPPHRAQWDHVSLDELTSVLSPLRDDVRWPNLRSIHWRGTLKNLVKQDPEMYAGPGLREVRGAVQHMGSEGRYVDKFVRKVRQDDGTWVLEDDLQEQGYSTDAPTGWLPPQF